MLSNHLTTELYHYPPNPSRFLYDFKATLQADSEQVRLSLCSLYEGLQLIAHNIILGMGDVSL